MVDELGRRPVELKGRPLSKTWFKLFMRRWPTLKLVSPSKLEMNRAKATTKEAMSNYFSELKRIMDKYQLYDKPGMVYNMDETNFNAEHKPPKVVGEKGKKTNSIISHRSATTTLIACGNAAGRSLPPYYVFKGKRRTPELLDGALPGSNMDMTESGWSNTEVLTNFLKNHFLPNLPPRQDDEYVLLLYDGHTSHVARPVVEFARKNRILLFVLPAHTSHISQPLDVACFGSMKRTYGSECAKYMQENPGIMITRYDIARLTSPAYLRALRAENLKAAFRKAGIVPFDPTALGIEEVTQTSTLVTPAKPTAAPASAHDIPHNVGPNGDNGEHHTSHSQSEAVRFLASKTPSPPQPPAEKKTKKGGTPQFRASGLCITEDHVYLKLVQAEEEREKAKATKRGVKKAQKSGCGDQTGPSNDEPEEENSRRRKAKVSRKSKGGNQVGPLNDQQEEEKSTKRKAKVSRKSGSADQAGPSGTSSKECNRKLFVPSAFDSEAEDDENPCCVCRRNTPPHPPQEGPMIFTWVACDKPGCNHWVHQIYCTETNHSYGKNDVYYCPCH